MQTANLAPAMDAFTVSGRGDVSAEYQEINLLRRRVLVGYPVGHMTGGLLPLKAAAIHAEPTLPARQYRLDQASAA